MNLDNSASLIAQQAPMALALMFFQNWMKQQKWAPWITYETTRANHLFAIAASLAATIGIHATYSFETHTLIISNLTLAVVLSGLWHWAQQYLLTKTAYVALQPNLNPVVAQVPTAVVVVSPAKEILNGVKD